MEDPSTLNSVLIPEMKKILSEESDFNLNELNNQKDKSYVVTQVKISMSISM